VISALCTELAARWPSLGLPGEPPTGGLVIGMDKAPNAKVVLMLFDAAGNPSVIVKTGRTDENDVQLRAEFDVLSHFWDGGLRARIPQPLGLFEVGERLCLAQTALPGRPMTAVYYTPGHVSNRAAVTGDFAAATDWLGEFHRHTAQTPISLEEWRATEFADLMKLYRAKVGYNGREEPLFALIDDRMDALKEAKVPQTGLHGDFWMGNLMLGGGKRGQQTTITGVIDWELGGPTGTPIHDIYKFPTSYGFYLDRTVPWAKGKVKGHPGREDTSGRWRSYSSWPNMLGFGHSYFGSADMVHRGSADMVHRGQGWFPDLVRSFIRERESALGIDPALTPILFCCFLVDQAQRSTVPEFRDGYRAALAAFAEERDRTWLWSK
jgi:hypothetical protein